MTLCSYEALGLVASLTPTASGGVEKPLGKNPAAAAMEVDDTPEASSSTAAGPSSLPKGYGRIVRDADGNVVDVELPEDEDEEAQRAAEDGERLVEDIPDPAKQSGLAEWVAVGGTRRGSGAARTAVVQSESERHHA